MRTSLVTAILIAGIASATLSSLALAKGAGKTSNMSLQNSNGKNALDKDKGLDRASDRRSTRSLKNKSGKSKTLNQNPATR